MTPSPPTSTPAHTKSKAFQAPSKASATTTWQGSELSHLHLALNNCGKQTNPWMDTLGLQEWEFRVAARNSRRRKVRRMLAHGKVGRIKPDTDSGCWDLIGEVPSQEMPPPCSHLWMCWDAISTYYLQLSCDRMPEPETKKQ